MCVGEVCGVCVCEKALEITLYRNYSVKLLCDVVHVLM